jgi:hypothetical protein
MMSGENARKSSLVDYSKVSNQPAARIVPPPPPPTSTSAPSAQMDAVMRMMTGREERTIAEKLADSNRPTWEQYKKDHHDKLHFDTLDQKEMEQYRQTLDAERDRRMAGLPLQQESKKEKKKTSKKKKKRRRHSTSSESTLNSESAEEFSSEEDSRRKHKKRHGRHQKRKHDKVDSVNDDERRAKKLEKKRKRSHRNEDSE